MVEEQQPAKKVVKRVVKKTVTRPANDATQVRYGRPVTGTATRPKAKVASPGTTKTDDKPVRPKVDVASKARGAQRALAGRGSSAASTVSDAARSTTRRVGSAAANSVRSIRDWHFPLWDPIPAAAFTGAFVGLVSVGLGLAAKAMFTELRGVAAGGGRWGSLTFVVVTFVAFVIGELLLSAFGVAQARLISFLGIVLTIVTILGLFLGLADGPWALLVVPALGAAAFAVAHWLMSIAESSPTLPE